MLSQGFTLKKLNLLGEKKKKKSGGEGGGDYMSNEKCLVELGHLFI